MDEKNTTPVDTSVDQVDPAAAGLTAAADVPTESNESKFEKFLRGIFGDAKEGESSTTSKTGTDTAKTYTEADIQARLESERKLWEASQAERSRLEQLSPEEKTTQELEQLRGELKVRDLKSAAQSELDKDGFPVGLADLLQYGAFSDEAAMQSSLGALKETFQACLASAIKEKFRGKTPEGLGGAGDTGSTARDEVAKAIRGGF